jgi:type II secretory pathway component PulM
MIDLKSREKKIVAVCVAVVLAALIHVLVISPSIKKRDNLSRSIHKTNRQLAQLRKLGSEYDQILRESEAIRRNMGGRGKGFELGPFLSKTANKLGLLKNLTSMRPSSRRLDANISENLVELGLNGVSLENLVKYLHEIERAGPAVAIAKIVVRPESRLGGGLKVTMLVTSITSN